jgi:hypothetical protein
VNHFYSSHRRLTLATVLLLLGVILLVLFRLPLIRAAANIAIQQRGMVLVDIQGLKISRQQLNIASLDLVLPGANYQLSIKQLRLGFSMADRQLQQLSIKQLDLLLLPPELSTDAAGQLLLKPLLQQLADIPLQSIRVNQFNYAAVGRPLQLHWQRLAPNRQHWRIDDAQQALTMELLWGNAGGAVEAQLNWQQPGQAPLPLQLRLQALTDGDGYQLTVSAEHNVVSLLAAAADYYPLPPIWSELSDGASGKLAWQWQSLLAADLGPLLGGARWSGSFTRASLNLALAPPLEPTWHYQLKAELGSPLYLQLQDHQSMQLAADTLQVKLESASSKQQLLLDIAGLDCGWQPLIRCQAKLALQLAADQLTVADVAVAELAAQWQGNVDLQGSQLRVAVDSGASAQLSLSADDWQLQRLKLQTDGLLTLAYQLDQAALNITASGAQFTLPALSSADTTLFAQGRLDDVQFSYAGSAALSLNLSAPKVRVTKLGQWIPELGLAATVAVKKQLLAVNGLLASRPDKPLLTLDIQQQLDTGEGKVTATLTPLQFDITRKQALSSWFSSWPFKGDLHSGELGANAELAWRYEQGQLVLRGMSTQQLNNVTGFYQDIGIVGLSTQHQLRIDAVDQWASVQPADVAVQLLDVGLPVTAITARFTVDGHRQQLQVPHFQAKLLGGSIATDDFIYQVDADNLLTLMVADVQLEKIVSLAAYNDLQATGLISGKLPVSITGQGVSIDLGQLDAEVPGGIIRYHSAVATENPAMKLVTDALQNYHYETLHSDVHYSPAGDLELSMKLRGQNPTMNKGQRINLNLNVSDNIPTLLKSLQSSRVITDVLEKKISQK